MLVLAVDVGIRNIAYCAMLDGQIVEWANEPLCEEVRYEPASNVRLVKAFVDKHAQLFARADHVVVEKQMRANMRIIEALLHLSHYDKCTIVHARTVKAAFGLSRSDYRLNKLAAVEYVSKRLEALDDPWRARFEASRKRDDLADSFLLAHFFGTRVVTPCTKGSSGPRPQSATIAALPACATADLSSAAAPGARTSSGPST